MQHRPRINRTLGSDVLPSPIFPVEGRWEATELDESDNLQDLFAQRWW